MENENHIFHVYFYAKKEPRKRDGRFSIMGRIVYRKEKLQFSTNVYLDEEMLPHITIVNLGGKKTKDLVMLRKIRDGMKLLYWESIWANEEIDLRIILSKYKAKKDDPLWWKAMG